MRKIETIWHHLLWSALEKKQFRHTQSGLAEFFGYSVSTVNHALKAPTQIGAIKKGGKFFVLESFQKLLYFWASNRNLEKDIVFSTYYPGNVLEIEGLLPSEAIFACYTSAKKILGEPPADYDKVYFYANDKTIEQVKKRFAVGPKTGNNKPKNKANLFALRTSPTMKQYGEFTTLPQTFVDVWNLKDWYSRDFCLALEKKINGILS